MAFGVVFHFEMALGMWGEILVSVVNLLSIITIVPKIIFTFFHFFIVRK